MTDAEYIKIVNHLEDLLEFHSEYLESLTPQDKEDIRTYFFAGREVDHEDVLVYRQQVLGQDPQLEARALAAYEQLQAASKG